MRFAITALQDHLRAELFDRETVGETREFLAALGEEALRQGSPRILICVNVSRPIFKVEDYQASYYMKELAARPTARVALVSNRHDIRAAHEYIEVLARQQGANVRSFADEAKALRWLRSEIDTPADAARPVSAAAKDRKSP
jgi:hypothetical protein